MKSSEKGRSGHDAAGRAGLIAGSALCGAAAAVLVMRLMSGAVETISTMSLLSFFLMSGLVTAAMVLAVTAILLSRTAERAVSEKSAELSALQAAVLAKVSSGNGRIDLCLSHAGQPLAEPGSKPQIQVTELPDETSDAKEEPEAPEEESVEEEPFGETSSGEISAEPEPVAEPEPGDPSEPEQPVQSLPAADPEVYARADRKYGEFRDIVLLGAANYPGVVVRKVGEGEYRTEGDDLVDGAFIMKKEQVAVCTFATGEMIADRFFGKQGDRFDLFLDSILNEFGRGHFTRIFLVFDGKLTSSSPYTAALNGLSRRTDAEVFSRFELFEGTPDVVIPGLTERISQLMEAPDDSTDTVPQDLSFRRRANS